MRKKSYRKAIISTMLATSMVVGTVEEAGVLFPQKVVAATGEEDSKAEDDIVESAEDGFVISDAGVLIDYVGTAKDVVIPDNVKAIKQLAFSRKEVEKVTIPDSVTELGENVFSDCQKLKEVVIGNGIKVIPKKTFSNNQSLERVSLGKGIREIDDFAFYKTKSLKNIDFPKGLTKIGIRAFDESGITAVTIPGSVTDWGYLSFQKCTSLTTVVIEDGVRAVPDLAFNESSQLSEVTFPNTGLEEIGQYAFASTNLTVANIPSCGYLSWNALGKKIRKVKFGN